MSRAEKVILGISLALLAALIMISGLFNKSENTSETSVTTQITDETTTVSTTSTTTNTTAKTTVKTTKKSTTKFSKVATASKEEYMTYAKQQSGYNDTQMQCLDWLWTRESGWNPNSYYKDACGIPQSKPCKKIKNQEGSYDWQAQIRWGIKYIAGRYHGDPCSAWNHFKNHKPHWY